MESPSRGRFLLAVPLALTLALAAGCASAGSASSGEPSTGSREVIAQDELAEFGDRSVYEAVRRLRPRWLRARSRRAGLPVVYMDGASMGGVDALRRVSVLKVLEIRHMNARDATTRYGTGHGGGVILVVTRGGGR